MRLCALEFQNERSEKSLQSQRSFVRLSLSIKVTADIISSDFSSELG
jgi:hypothetical protein